MHFLFFFQYADSCIYCCLCFVLNLCAFSFQAQMSHQSDSIEEKESENLPTFGAGSEFGRERREEARKKRRGFVTQPKDPESAPWNLKIGGKNGRRLYTILFLLFNYML